MVMHHFSLGGAPDQMAKARSNSAAKSIAAEIIDDPEYRRMLKLRANAGDLPPAVETMLWHFRFGKPTEHVILDHGDDLSEMTDQELAEEISALQRELAASAEGKTH
jgi:hypothetical protein